MSSGRTTVLYRSKMMFNLIDETLEKFLRAEVPLPSDIDVAFDRPDRLWSASVTRPTVNLFLWDLRRNASDQESGDQFTG